MVRELRRRPATRNVVPARLLVYIPVMKDIPEAEARALLAAQYVCPDPSDWRPVRGQAGTSIVECGLLNADGASVGLHVQLLVRRGLKTGLWTFKFTIFRVTIASLERVYQLHVRQLPKPPRDRHQLPHEHVGAWRSEGAAEWLNWDYAEALDHFCRQTNIIFVPPVSDPEAFELRS